MLPPQLRQTAGLRPSLRQLSVTKHKCSQAIPLPALTQACRYSWWHKQGNWLSSSDTEHEHYLRRRSHSTKAKLVKLLQRQEKWDRLTPSSFNCWVRHASVSNKASGQSSVKNEAGVEPANDRRRQKLERLRHKFDTRWAEEWARNEGDGGRQKLMRLRQKFDAQFAEDPYEAVFGRRFEPFWNRLMPNFLKQELAASQMSSATSGEGSGTAAQPSEAQANAAPSSRMASFQMRSSHRAGSEPSISAWSSAWDSSTNTTRRAFYDPITGRMVDEPADPPKSVKDAQPAPPTYQKPPILSTLPEDDVDLLTSSDVRASMGKVKKQPVMDSLAARAHQLATLEADYEIKIANTEHEELVEARKTLEALRVQVQILERKAHASTLTKPEDIPDAERPPVFETGWNDAPQGMQTAFENEREASEHGDKKSLEEEMSALNSAPVQEINDGYEPTPTGMQTQYELENSGETTTPSLEQEMAALNKEAVAPHNDDYSTTPVGLQTLYEKEEEGLLEQEINDKLKRKEHDDGYSTSPTGMQTTFDNEEAGSLEQELNDRLNRKDHDDGYSKAPTGMQNLYEKEDAGTLEQELSDNLKHKDHDDGYSTAPSGMQTLYESEDDGVLAKELKEKLKNKTYDDGYATNPKGMQNTFEQEMKHVKDGRAKSLEHEMQDRERAKSHDDGYTTRPIGMQTAYNAERRESAAGKRESLEEEMKSGLEAPPTDGGFATMPIGLQILFRQEQIEAEKNKRGSLEDELKTVRSEAVKSRFDTEIEAQKTRTQDHEDGYSRTPMGMQSSFRKEQQLKALQGEGDLCPNVGKFCNSRRWYKQPASNYLSEEIQKAQQKSSDVALVREIRDIYEHQYGPITTEHQQPQPAALSEERAKETAHEVVANDNDNKAEAARTHDTTDNNLVQELEDRRAPVDESTTSEHHASERRATSPATAPVSSIRWAEPAVYKVIAYDVDKEAISITTTPSNFSNSDTPISISSALSRLHQPARFIPHFAKLQKEGYQVINASRDWIVLRKVDKGPQTAPESFVNPIDPKMSRRIHYEELPAGRFASPTGFVNDDPIFPSEPPQPGPGETVTVEIPVHGGPDFDRYRNRRVRREEPVYSGTRRWRDRRHDGQDRREKRRLRDRITWALSVGAATAVSMYVVGVVSELAKGDEKREKKQ